ncbi:MAG: hypothetical protein LBG75_01570 [Candidatus Nomurabacteria bacterium]|jgi:hypothetical protein|nr:hypothetical protein [Candidatus Nomurabacteria bacterium]
MAEYHQRSVSEDPFLRDLGRGEVKDVLATSLLAGLLIAGGTLFLQPLTGLATEQVFSICLLVVSIVTLVIYARLRVRSGALIFAANLLAFWGFLTVQPLQPISCPVFGLSFAALSLLFLQIFRLRKVWLAVLLCLPLVVLPHLV